MFAKIIMMAALGAVCLLAGAGCTRAETDGTSHYGYTGSLPAACASCEE